MKVILLGNAGSGKSTLARQLAARHPANRLSLDEVAFAEGAERHPLQKSVAAVRDFVATHDSWILEGCYADIIEPLFPSCEWLVFLNPGVATCVAHCNARPWEPEKFATKEAQDDNLANLIAWAKTYETRDDEYGLKRHRAMFGAFPGRKQELNDPAMYDQVLGMLSDLL